MGVNSGCAGISPTIYNEVLIADREIHRLVICINRAGESQTQIANVFDFFLNDNSVISKL